MIKLLHPVKDFDWQKKISQLFGVNKTLYQTNFNIPGHNGFDYTGEYGTPILAAHNGVINELKYETYWRTKGNGIYLLSDEGFITIYWHLSEIQVVIGQRVVAGEVIGLMGNTGFVRPIPTQLNPHAGTHLHFGLYIDKYRGNEYGGYVDPLPYLFNEGERLPLYWPVDLTSGCDCDYVAWLQSCLKLEGFAQDYQPIGYFGNKTKRDVGLFQDKYKIDTGFLGIARGRFGPKTRKLMMEKYSSFQNQNYGLIDPLYY